MEGSFDLFLTLATILPKIGKKYLELFLVFSINVSFHCLQFCQEGEGDPVKKFVWIRVSKQMCLNFHNFRVYLQPIGRYALVFWPPCINVKCKDTRTSLWDMLI